MAKKKIKKEVEKTDILLKFVEIALTFIRKNMKFCIVGALIVIAICSGVYGYTIYERKQHEKSQALLFEGIEHFEQYTLTGKEENLNRAEELLTQTASQKRDNIQRIAKLYLAKISYIKEKKEEAKRIYEDLRHGPPGDIVTILAEKALKQIEK